VERDRHTGRNKAPLVGVVVSPGEPKVIVGEGKLGENAKLMNRGDILDRARFPGRGDSTDSQYVVAGFAFRHPADGEASLSKRRKTDKAIDSPGCDVGRLGE